MIKKFKKPIIIVNIGIITIWISIIIKIDDIIFILTITKFKSGI